MYNNKSNTPPISIKKRFKNANDREKLDILLEIINLFEEAPTVHTIAKNIGVSGGTIYAKKGANPSVGVLGRNPEFIQAFIDACNSKGSNYQLYDFGIGEKPDTDSSNFHKLSDEEKLNILLRTVEELETIPTINSVCKKLGVSTSTVYNLKKHGKAVGLLTRNPDFMDKFSDAVIQRIRNMPLDLFIKDISNPKPNIPEEHRKEVDLRLFEYLIKETENYDGVPSRNQISKNIGVSMGAIYLKNQKTKSSGLLARNPKFKKIFDDTIVRKINSLDEKIFLEELSKSYPSMPKFQQYAIDKRIFDIFIREMKKFEGVPIKIAVVEKMYPDNGFYQRHILNGLNNAFKRNPDFEKEFNKFTDRKVNALSDKEFFEAISKQISDLSKSPLKAIDVRLLNIILGEIETCEEPKMGEILSKLGHSHSTIYAKFWEMPIKGIFVRNPEFIPVFNEVFRRKNSEFDFVEFRTGNDKKQKKEIKSMLTGDEKAEIKNKFSPQTIKLQKAYEKFANMVVRNNFDLFEKRYVLEIAKFERKLRDVFVEERVQVEDTDFAFVKNNLTVGEKKPEYRISSYADKSFSTIFANNSLYAKNVIQHTGLILSEANRLLFAGGVLIITFPLTYSITKNFDELIKNCGFELEEVERFTPSNKSVKKIEDICKLFSKNEIWFGGYALYLRKTRDISCPKNFKCFYPVKLTNSEREFYKINMPEIPIEVFETMEFDTTKQNAMEPFRSRTNSSTPGKIECLFDHDFAKSLGITIEYENCCFVDNSRKSERTGRKIKEVEQKTNKKIKEMDNRINFGTLDVRLAVYDIYNIAMRKTGFDPVTVEKIDGSPYLYDIERKIYIDFLDSLYDRIEEGVEGLAPKPVDMPGENYQKSWDMYLLENGINEFLDAYKQRTSEEFSFKKLIILTKALLMSANKREKVISTFNGPKSEKTEFEKPDLKKGLKN
ncbi:hypothetical protein KO465_05635 [Candidatus Micrarchaeota archaeon]|nr:hypothetical protein [Candidatus Micrarchaeota archaeon]